MGELITISERNVKPKGAKKGSIPHQEELKRFFFREELRRLELLKAVTPFPNDRIQILYPGCGSDILTILLYLESLFPQAQEAHCLFIDVYNNVGLIKTILDEIGIPFSAHKNNLEFYWGNLRVELEFKTGNIFKLLPSLDAVDVYFERAFRIMKDDHKDYEQMVMKKLISGGVLISDSGFQNTSLRKIDVPRELSAYGEMMVGIKTN